ncbi:MAG: serine hydrolase [Litorilinea sp.]
MNDTSLAGVPLADDLLANDEVRSNLALLESWIAAQVEHRALPSLAVGIVYDQNLIWTRGFGFADVAAQTAATQDTVYRIASLTKLFTSTAIMQLRDDGLLQLDDPVEKHLDWFQVQNPYDDAPVVTIRHLLTHAAGLPREAAFPYWSDRKFPTIEEVRQALPSQSLVQMPGTQWKYSNLGLSLAGAIVAAVAGTSYADYIAANILKPLGMASTYVDVSPDVPNAATGYGARKPDGSRDVVPFTDCKGIAPAANMASTVADLAQFAMLQMRGGPRQGAQVLKGASIREMHQMHYLHPGWQTGRGLGWHLWRLNGKTLVGHGGALEGFRTDVQICTEDKVAAVVLSNSHDAVPVYYMEKIFKWVVPALVKAANPPSPAVAPDAWHRYVGRYHNTWTTNVQVLVYNNKLVVIYPEGDDPMAYHVVLTPVDDHRFRIEGGDPGGAPGELAWFETDDAGKVTRLNMGNNFYEPYAETGNA